MNLISLNICDYNFYAITIDIRESLFNSINVDTAICEQCKPICTRQVYLKFKKFQQISKLYNDNTWTVILKALDKKRHEILKLATMRVLDQYIIMLESDMLDQYSSPSAPFSTESKPTYNINDVETSESRIRDIVPPRSLSPAQPDPREPR